MLLDDIEKLLIQAKTSIREERFAYIQKAQNLIWDDESIKDEILNEILTGIAYDLDFYEPNEEWRKEDPSYYGDKRLKQEIKHALRKIEIYKRLKKNCFINLK